MSTFAKVFAVIFVLLGILGFISNPLVGTDGLFETDLLHNLVHIILGVMLFAWANPMGLKLVGVVYLVLALLGFVMGGDKVLGFLMVNPADNWLHLVLGVVLLGAGFMGKNEAQPAQPA